LIASDYSSEVQELYITYYGRPADPAGLAYWDGVMLADNAPTDIQSLNAAYSTNAAVKAIVDGFGGSSESQARYGTGNSLNFINTIYSNALGRGADLGGLMYWGGLLNNHTMTQAQAALAIISAAAAEPATSSDEQLVAKRLTVANYFTAQVSIQNAQSAYSGLAAVGYAEGILGGVTAVTDTAAYQSTVDNAVTYLIDSDGLTKNPWSGNSVTWSGTEFVSIGYDGILATSPDGIVWTRQTLPAGNPLTGLSFDSVAWLGTQFVAVGSAGGAAICFPGQVCSAAISALYPVIFTSPDGLSWTAQFQSGLASVTGDSLNGVASSGAQFAAVGSNGIIFTSPTGVNWTPQTSNTINALNGIVWSGIQFVAVGASGSILTSPTGAVWTTQNSGTSQTLASIVWSGTQYLAVGANGVIITSPDGVNWTPQNSNTINNLNAVTWSGQQFIAVGANGTVLASADGKTWTSRSAPTPNTLNSVVWSGTQFAVVGPGAVLTSPDGVTWTMRPLP
jgi:hypothetical protein